MLFVLRFPLSSLATSCAALLPTGKSSRHLKRPPLLLQAVGPVAVTSLLLGTGLKNVVGKEVAIQADPNTPTSPADQDIYNHAAVQVGPFRQAARVRLELVGRKPTVIQPSGTASAPLGSQCRGSADMRHACAV